MIYKVAKPDKSIKSKIRLVSSKSISNRLLMIRALSGKYFNIENLSEAKDTQVLDHFFKYPSKFIDVGAGGTTMRFLTAFLSMQKGEWILTGSDQLKKRPVGILVDALRKLGAHIEYIEEDGYPPIKINGTELIGREIAVDASISSQFISALLLIAPKIKNGLRLRLEGKVVSATYLMMTLRLMEEYGIKFSNEVLTIDVKEQDYTVNNYEVESDWSAASYFYEAAAFAEEVDLELEGLYKNSVQGDAAIADIMEHLGVKTTYGRNGIRITKKKKSKDMDYEMKKLYKYDFKDYPDLTQTIVVASAGLGVNAIISGIENLRIKETNRIRALKRELRKLDVNFARKLVGQGDAWSEHEIWLCKGKVSTRQGEYGTISTHDDHRMAMAFAPLALITGSINIEDPDVVAKSYPYYWQDLESIGFHITEMT